MGWSVFAGGTKTINIYDRVPLIPSDKDFYNTMLIRYKNKYKDNKATIISLISNINNITNTNILKALGYASEVPIVIKKLTKEKILAYIKKYYDNNAKYVNDFLKYEAILHRANLYLLDNYEYDYNHTKNIKESVTVDNITINDDFKSPVFTINNNNYFLDSVDNNIITLIELDKDYNETNNKLEIEADLSKYNSRVGVIYNDNVTIAFEVVEELYYITGDTGLMLVIKKDKTLIDKSKSNIVLSNVGISSVDIFNQLNDDKIIDALITYLGKQDGIFEQWIKDNYTVDTVIQIENKGISLKFVKESTGSNNSYNEYVYFNDTRLFSNVFNNTIPIPLNQISKLPLRDKYKATQEILSLLVHSKYKQDLHWYQTDTVTTIINMGAILSMVFAPNPLLAMALYTLTTITYANTDNIRIKTFIAIAAIIAGNYESISNMSMNAVELVQITNQLVSIYFNIEYYSINKDISKIEKEKQEITDKLNEEYLYEPYKRIDDYYTITQDNIYYNYELIDEMCSVHI